MIAFHDRSDDQCTTFRVGQIVALWGHCEGTAGFLVESMDNHVDKDYMTLSLRKTGNFERVAPMQLCCHEPFNAMNMGEKLGMMCSLACAPTFFGRL